MPSTKSKLTQKYSFCFSALGTQWQIDTDLPPSSTVTARIRSEIDGYEKVYSRFREDSIVAELSRLEGTYLFPADFEQLFELYMACYKATNGAMTPLIGRALEQLGYDKDYSLQQRKIGTIPTVEDALVWDGASTITTKRPLVLDIGAAGKGQAVDRITAILKDAGFKDFTIDASGDIYHVGYGEVIGLEHPGDPTKVIGTVFIKDQSLCASASNRRAWSGIHHIIDARTLQPTQEIVATWVIANTAMVADGLATALFFTNDVRMLKKAFDFSYVRMSADGTVDYSSNFKGQLFT